MKSPRDEYIKNQIDATFRQWLTKAALLGSLFIILFGIVDLYSSPDLFGQSFLYRISLAGFLLLGYFLLRQNRFTRYVAPLSIVWVAIISFVLEFAILAQSGSEVRYVIGNIVMAVIVIGFIPARLPFVFTIAILLYFFSVIPLSLGTIHFNQFDPIIILIYHGMILSSLVLMRHITEQSVVHELGMKYDLDLVRNKLEEQVKERTTELSHTIESLKHEIMEREKIEQQHKALQEQYAQGQKMESIGRLAGGIAHDINNILSTIIMANSLAKIRISPLHPVFDNLKMIDIASDRAVNVIQQLLAFSRKQVLSLKTIDLNAIIRENINMLSHMIGENITIHFKCEDNLQYIKADTTQMSQILINLSVNARDAMKNGGTITIATANVAHQEIQHFAENISPDISYVKFTFTDNGSGMTEDVRKNIFEPFFTTKQRGKGTGLGLATVYGIVKQHNGHITVESQPGEGTTFSIFIPASTMPVKELGPFLPESSPKGKETILLVEDDQMIRNLATDVLTSLGYTVIPAESGEDAIEKSKDYHGFIDLLLTDVIMPGMNGRILAEQLTVSRPKTKVIFMSGYSDDILGNYGITHTSDVFIQKPLRPEVLATKVRSILEESII